MIENTQPYYFQAKPRPISSKSLPQEEMRTINIQVYKNLMFDQKVVRGNTASMNFRKTKADVTLKNAQLKENRFATIKKGQIKALMVKSNSNVDKYGNSKGSKVRTGCFVDHNDRLMTNLPAYIALGTQTEAVIEKVMPDLKYEFEYGIDKDTQIIEAELFNFDKEVEPLVSTLTARILAESYKEVQRDIEQKTLTQIQDNTRNKSRVENNQLKSYLEKEKEVLEMSRKKYMQFEKSHKLKMCAQKKMVAREYAKHLLVRIEIEFQDHYCLYQNVESDKVMMYMDTIRPNIEKKIVQNLDRLKSVNKQLVKVYSRVNEMGAIEHRKTVEIYIEQERVREEKLKAELQQKIIEKKERRDARRAERERIKELKVLEMANREENRSQRSDDED